MWDFAKTFGQAEWSGFQSALGTPPEGGGAGWLAGKLLIGLAARAPIGEASEMAAVGGDAASETSAARGIRSLTKNIEEHTQKLEDYKSNPDAFDNKGFLKNASPEIREKIIDGRIRHLEREIKEFKSQLQALQSQSTM